MAMHFPLPQPFVEHLRTFCAAKRTGQVRLTLFIHGGTILRYELGEAMNECYDVDDGMKLAWQECVREEGDTHGPAKALS